MRTSLHPYNNGMAHYVSLFIISEQDFLPVENSRGVFCFCFKMSADTKPFKWKHEISRVSLQNVKTQIAPFAYYFIEKVKFNLIVQFAKLGNINNNKKQPYFSLLKYHVRQFSRLSRLMK